MVYLVKENGKEILKSACVYHMEEQIRNCNVDINWHSL